MKIDPAGRVPGPSTEPVAAAAKQTNTPPPGDRIDLSGPEPADATYTRLAVSGAAAMDSSQEVLMAPDARAQKLAEIRQRMDAGVYNSRDMIERVVDRLLDTWKLGPLEKSGSTS